MITKKTLKEKFIERVMNPYYLATIAACTIMMATALLRTVGCQDLFGIGNSLAEKIITGLSTILVAVTTAALLWRLLMLIIDANNKQKKEGHIDAIRITVFAFVIALVIRIIIGAIYNSVDTALGGQGTTSTGNILDVYQP